MAIPTYEQCMSPFLEVLKDGEPHRTSEIVDSISDLFGLTPEERATALSGGQRVIINRVGWARTYLKKAGLVVSPKRGLQVITDAGRKAIAEKPFGIDAKYLEQFESFRDFKNAKPTPETSSTKEHATELAATPEESIDAFYSQLQQQLSTDLLEKVKACTPYFFEEVVLRLLQAMGYGGISGSGIVTPATHDGGIDGVIHEDKLGLDSVCIQAKRWEGTVGRPKVQEFVGSMDLHRSRKGVIITTGRFSQDAMNFVDRIEGKKVVLIDGDKLCHLMIEHRVGVTTKRRYELLDISEDFFDEDE